VRLFSFRYTLSARDRQQFRAVLLVDELPALIYAGILPGIFRWAPYRNFQKIVVLTLKISILVPQAPTNGVNSAVQLLGKELHNASLGASGTFFQR
jgi:hypothetical protein